MKYRLKQGGSMLLVVILLITNCIAYDSLCSKQENNK